MLKKMTWPLMDEDGLPSSYITKVLACLGKWRVKMQQLIEGFEADSDQPEHSKENLRSDTFFLARCILYLLMIVIATVLAKPFRFDSQGSSPRPMALMPCC